MDKKEAATAAIISAISSMNHPKKFALDMILDLPQLLHKMDTLGYELEHFGFSIHGSRAAEDLNAIQSSQAASSVSSLAITTTNSLNNLSLLQPLTDLCNNLDHLVQLKFDSAAGNTLMMFISLFENLMMLENLEFDGMTIRREDQDELVFNKVERIISRDRLKSISLSRLNIESSDNSFQKFNLLIRYVLGSSPNLDKLRVIMATNSQARGRISMDFRGNGHLKFIKLGMPNCRHFTFNHAFGSFGKTLMKRFKVTKILQINKQDNPTS